MKLSSIRYHSSQYLLFDWVLIKVTGADRETFFQGQVTNDLSLLKESQGQLTARLNRVGKLQSFFFIAKFFDHLYLLCPEAIVLEIKEDFEKYIIMDDVILEIEKRPLWLQFNSFLNTPKNVEPYFDFNFYGLNARLVFRKEENLILTDEIELEEIRILNGWPKWGEDVDREQFINDSILNDLAISYKKGCFLGQETAAKIENNRGAAYYPVLLELPKNQIESLLVKKDFMYEGRKAGSISYQVRNLLQVRLFRDFRVIDRKLELEFFEGKIEALVRELPFYKSIKREDISLELYHLGVDAFQMGDSELAKNFMRRSLDFFSEFADAYETLGVILGRAERFEEAIAWMDKLLLIKPQSVMAHTNKSLYLMKLGRIEEAEAEKSLATVKSFAIYGEEAKLKKQIELEQKKKEEELLRREKMFLQVLEIDDEDSIALYGMADIYFMRKNYLQAISNLEKVLAVDSKYSIAYLLLGKAYEAEGKKNKAQDIYLAGITTASKLGDMMPANEMQSRLNQLVMLTSLD